jgi:hypothetical protein
MVLKRFNGSKEFKSKTLTSEYVQHFSPFGCQPKLLHCGNTPFDKFGQINKKAGKKNNLKKKWKKLFSFFQIIFRCLQKKY